MVAFLLEERRHLLPRIGGRGEAVHHEDILAVGRIFGIMVINLTYLDETFLSPGHRGMNFTGWDLLDNETAAA
jgi:hypothetical protein